MAQLLLPMLQVYIQTQIIKNCYSNILLALNATIEVINPLCFNETGSIVIQGLGGVGGYTYSVYNNFYFNVANYLLINNIFN